MNVMLLSFVTQLVVQIHVASKPQNPLKSQFHLRSPTSNFNLDNVVCSGLCLRDSSRGTKRSFNSFPFNCRMICLSSLSLQAFMLHSDESINTFSTYSKQNVMEFCN